MSEYVAVQGRAKLIKEVETKIPYITSIIPTALYPNDINLLLNESDRYTIINMFNTALALYNEAQTPHNYFWDIDAAYKQYKSLKRNPTRTDKVNAAFIKKAESLLSFCYPSAIRTLCFMLVLNRDYNCTWAAIYYFFEARPFQPEYKERNTHIAPRKAALRKPLTDNMIIHPLESSGYAESSIYFNLPLIRKDEKLFQGLTHILCGLQALREDLIFFDTPVLKKVVDEYWFAEYNKSRTDYEIEAEQAELNIWRYESEIDSLIEEQQYLITYYGQDVFNRAYNCDGFYNNRIKALKDEIQRLRQLQKDYAEDSKKLTNAHEPFWDETDIWPTPKQCKELWDTFDDRYNQLVNTIIVLVHAHKKDLDRITGYYAIPERRILLDAYPALDKESGDPFIINPKRARPLTGKVIDELGFKYKYSGKSAEEIMLSWGSESNLPQGVMYLIFHLQIEAGAKLIKADIFNEVFKKQIELDRFLPVDKDIIYDVINNGVESRGDVRNIIMLIDRGYQADEIYNYYSKKYNSEGE